MLTHRGFSAWITVDGRAAPEYLVEEDSESHRVSCWIPGDEGRAFAISWRDHGGKVDTCSFITLDGITVPGHFLYGEGVATRRGARTSLTTERPFVFQKVHQTVSSHEDIQDKDVGMITLRIKRVVRVGMRPANPMLELPKTRPGVKKSGDLCVRFGTEVGAYHQYPSTWQFRPYGGNPSAKYPSTFVTFVFRYCSREFLKSQGILDASSTIATKMTQTRRVASLPSRISQCQARLAVEPLKNVSGFSPLLRPVNPELIVETRRIVSHEIPRKRNEPFPGQGVIVFGESPQENVQANSGCSVTGSQSGGKN